MTGKEIVDHKGLKSLGIRYCKVHLGRLEDKGKFPLSFKLGEHQMWNADRGFGFIKDDSGGPDTFMHFTVLQSAGIDPASLRIGERLTFDVESARDGRNRAGNVRRPG